MEPIVLSLRKKSIPVTLENEQGVPEKYILQEISGEDRDKYLTLTVNRVKMNEEGKPSGVTSFEGLQSTLISMSLVKEETKEKVAKEVIAKYPSTVQVALFKAAQELSGLKNKKDDDEEDDEVKND